MKVWLLILLILGDYSVASSKQANIKNDSVIYLYRGNAKLSGLLQEAWFYVDGLKIASLKPKQYIAVRVTPGKHTIEVRGDTNYKKNAASISIGKNQSLYLEADPTAGKTITTLVAPYVDEGTVKSFGIKKVEAKTFAKLKPKLTAATMISYEKTPLKSTPNMAHVYIYRNEAGIKSGVQTAWIYNGGKKVAHLDDHQYIVFALKEGKHTLSVRGEENPRKETLKLNVKPGQNYYFTLKTNGAHAATYAATPLLDLVVSKAFKFVQTDKKQFNAVENRLGRLKLMQ